MTIEDPTLSEPPSQEDLARDLAAIVDVDESLAYEIIHTLEGGDTVSEFQRRGNHLRRQLGHRLRQARLRE